MALMAVLESDLRALSAEARRRYPTVKDSAEHAILKEAWHPVRTEVSKLSTSFLMARCDFILSQLIVDEHNLGERPLPNARLEEAVYVLHELARLVIHMDTVPELPPPPALKRSLAEDDNHFRRSHLLVLFPSFCELVGSRQSRIRELVQILP